MPFPKNREFLQLVDRAKKQLQSNLPFVIYRKPGERRIRGLFQNQPTRPFTTNFQESGFLFAPFDSLRDSILLEPEEHIVFDFDTASDFSPHPKAPIQYGRKEHLALVEKAIEEINSTKLNKVIVSRKIGAMTKKKCFEIFESALSQYKNSFCYLWHHPKTGIWVGASPEVFLKIKDEVVKTVSLAGTMKTKNGEKPVWGTKEIEEQQMVTDYIQTCFLESLDNVEVSKAETVKAGTVWHLKSTISGNPRKDFDVENLIENLHPTPAVCGFPKKNALKFIQENEAYDRSYYTGFLGEWDIQNKAANLFVNLRCMKLTGNKAAIFVGGGITKNSIPELEWDETQHKSATMLSLL